MSRIQARTAIPSNLRLEGNFMGCASLSFEYEGAKYHVWVPVDTWQIPPDATIYKQSSRPGFPLKLPVTGATGRKVLPTLISELPGLIPLYQQRQLEEASLRQQEESANRRIHQLADAAPRLYSALVKVSDSLELAIKRSNDRGSLEEDTSLFDAKALLAELKEPTK